MTGGCDILEKLRYPVRFDECLVLLVRRGAMQLSLNLDTHDVRERSLLVVAPGSIVCLSAAEPGADVACARIPAEYVPSADFCRQPCLELSDGEYALIEDYYSLAEKLASNKESLGALMTSLMYTVAALQDGHAGSCEDNRVCGKFLELVREHHRSERGMAFYARELSLTPKYLSKLVKQASGRSGPQWIDSMVVMEAKHMLKYSRKSIGEIVAYLHFPSPGVFSKYFKTHTGMTPSEYRKV